jgi:dolichyl-phosphate beta-glucosyltransferase
MISIIIAAYNEERRIGESLLKIRDYLTKRALDYEIIVVNDGSTDHTKQILKHYYSEITNFKIISYPINKGKGYALRQGVSASIGEIVLLTDADLSTPIEELAHMLHLISCSEYEVIIGSRALKTSMIIKKQSWWRQGMGKVFNRFVKLIVLNDFHDTQCGFKIFSGKTARSLFKDARVDRFAYDVEILAMAVRKGFKILEAPVKWMNSSASKVNPVCDSLQMLYDLVKIRWKLGLPQYDSTYLKNRQDCLDLS